MALQRRATTSGMLCRFGSKVCSTRTKSALLMRPTGPPDRQKPLKISSKGRPERPTARRTRAITASASGGSVVDPYEGVECWRKTLEGDDAENMAASTASAAMISSNWACCRPLLPTILTSNISARSARERPEPSSNRSATKSSCDTNPWLALARLAKNSKGRSPFASMHRRRPRMFIVMRFWSPPDGEEGMDMPRPFIEAACGSSVTLSDMMTPSAQSRDGMSFC